MFGAMKKYIFKTAPIFKTVIYRSIFHNFFNHKKRKKIFMLDFPFLFVKDEKTLILFSEKKDKHLQKFSSYNERRRAVKTIWKCYRKFKGNKSIHIIYQQCVYISILEIIWRCMESLQETEN